MIQISSIVADVTVALRFKKGQSPVLLLKHSVQSKRRCGNQDSHNDYDEQENVVLIFATGAADEAFLGS